MVKKQVEYNIARLTFIGYSLYSVVAGAICYPENTNFNFAGVWEYNADTGNFYCNYMKFFSSDFVSPKFDALNNITNDFEIMIDDSYDFIN